MDALPNVILLWRLDIIQEVLLSGFQLELYLDDEKSFVYWELGQVTHEHLATLHALEPVIPEGELVFKLTVLVLNIRSIGRYQSAWRTYVLTLISQRLPVILHGNVHGKIFGRSPCALLTDKYERCSLHYQHCDNQRRVSH